MIICPSEIIKILFNCYNSFTRKAHFIIEQLVNNHTEIHSVETKSTNETWGFARLKFEIPEQSTVQCHLFLLTYL
jgi:hypothetical protein